MRKDGYVNFPLLETEMVKSGERHINGRNKTFLNVHFKCITNFEICQVFFHGAG